MKLKCTYCKHELVLRSPARTHRGGVDVLRLVCPNCGELFLATDAEYSHPYQTHHKRDPRLIKRVRSIRLSDVEMDAVAKGRITLTVSDNRITLAV